VAAVAGVIGASVLACAYVAARRTAGSDVAR
jgi:hypothetical protein